MMRFFKKLTAPKESATTLTLPWEQRNKSRLMVRLDNGMRAGLFMERGSILREDDLLLSEEGLVVRIRAAAETVSTVTCDNALLMARACYHLGNRHTPAQITENRIQYPHDHVLDDMMKGLGLDVRIEQAPFEPETGAYGNQGHHHG